MARNAVENACGLKLRACLRLARFARSAERPARAIGVGQPRFLTLDRSGTEVGRHDAFRGIATSSGQDRYEYPPALAQLVGRALSVELIDTSSNRSAVAHLQRQSSGLPDGARFLVFTT